MFFLFQVTDIVEKLRFTRIWDHAAVLRVTWRSRSDLQFNLTMPRNARDEVKRNDVIDRLQHYYPSSEANVPL